MILDLIEGLIDLLSAGVKGWFAVVLTIAVLGFAGYLFYWKYIAVY